MADAPNGGAVPQPTPGLSDEPATELLLIRHGRSADFVPGTALTAGLPLHPIGVEQAAKLAQRLAHKHIDAIYSSTLPRAIQTAEPLAAARSLDIEQVSEIREIELGEWDNGEFRRRAAAKDPEWLAWSRTGRWDGIPGAETDEGFRRRVTVAIDEIAAAHRQQTVAVVCHSGVIGAYVASIFGVHRTVFFICENTSVTVVRVTDHGRVLVTLGDCNHLYDPVL
ncbi:MAG: histidine phosphatase family protein [Acidimicrobiia bacterium]